MKRKTGIAQSEDIFVGIRVLIFDAFQFALGALAFIEGAIEKNEHLGLAVLIWFSLLLMTALLPRWMFDLTTLEFRKWKSTFRSIFWGSAIFSGVVIFFMSNQLQAAPWLPYMTAYHGLFCTFVGGSCLAVIWRKKFPEAKTAKKPETTKSSNHPTLVRNSGSACTGKKSNPLDNSVQILRKKTG